MNIFFHTPEQIGTYPHSGGFPNRSSLILFLLAPLLFFPFCQALAQHSIEQEAWTQMRKMYRNQVSVTTVEEDIAALGGPDAKTAGPRLIDRGTDVLPAVHEALQQKDTSPRQAIALLQVMRALEDTSSVNVLLDLLNRYPTTPLRRDMLLTLAILPATAQAYSYNAKLAAAENEPWNTRRMAFTWFGFHREKSAKPIAEALRNDTDPERRATALYVLARLGDGSALEPVTRMLQEGPPAGYRDILLLSLAELTTPEDFKLRAPESLSWSGGYKHSLVYAQYRNAADADRPAVCRDLLSSSYPGHLGIAVRCLLESGHADDLRPYAALSLEAPGRDAMIRNEIRKAGWQIIDTDEEFRIIPPGS